MKKTIAAIFVCSLITGSAYAGYKHCRNNHDTCGCKTNYSTTLYSTGRYRVDLSKGPVWLNFNPLESGYYTFKIYKKSIAISLTECGKKGYVPAVFKKDCDSIVLNPKLCKQSTYRLFLNRARRSDSYVIVEISRSARRSSRVSKISSTSSRVSRIHNSKTGSRISRYSTNSCNTTRYKYYKRYGYYYRIPSSSYHYSRSSSRKKCFDKSGFSISFSF